ncbi:chromate efflux transporter [Aureibacillus halotolerans]|uniref:Chromate transporter n=1 Tax=Aureibacillus halotolerans TaxID=1508390 RepID=A0A4R6U4H3_9BACI|nr:chromate efflux transporter [Aureibacillus halotolerans]TDQ41041.1 chromate transporter [Aureibacillus halotolerans]
MTNRKDEARITCKSYWLLFLVSLKLGLTSFGGPTAHLGYFHESYVRRKQWLDETLYAHLVALAQFLPGPASSQVGMAIGIHRAGLFGGLVAFLGFTMPSVILLIAFAYMYEGISLANAGWIHGLKLVAAAIVAHAILGMAKTLAPDRSRQLLLLVALGVVLLWQTIWTQLIVIVLAALFGLLFLKTDQTQQAQKPFGAGVSKKMGAALLTLFFLLLFLLPLASQATDWKWLAMVDSFYRSGALVFGGGHVVLPLLEEAFVPTNWVSEDAFLAGYGAAQAVPGPLFTFASYLGTVMGGWTWGLMATAAIFLPAFLLVAGALPFSAHMQHSKLRGAVLGMNAAVVGLLVAAFFQPIWQTTVETTQDFLLFAVLFVMVAVWKWAPWIVVCMGIIGGWVLPYF